METEKLKKETGLNVIHTFIVGRKCPQEDILYKFIPEWFKDKKTLADMLIQNLYLSEHRRLHRISCCVFYCGNVSLPDWFMECNGKLFFENGELIEY